MISDDPIPSTLTTFTASDGENLAVQDWPLPEGEPCRGTVLLVHGLGEHVGRYDAVARRLNDWGFAVRGYDQYGHGESGGPRGGLTSDLRLLDDLADPLCHDRISARLARFIANGGAATVARAAHWSVPTLLMWAGSDKQVHPAGSRAFAAAAPKAVVHAHCFEPLFHELFNESPELAEPVFDLLQQWLVRRCPAVR